MSSEQIFILSQPIQTGKTTLLQNLIAGNNNIGGILTPDVNGVRKLLDVSSNIYYDFQLNETAEGIRIGRFVFDRKGFAKAQQLLLEGIEKQFDWLIIDEIGRLELDRKEGLEPTLSKVIHYFRTHKTGTKLLLVVRDYLLEDVKEHYQIKDATILDRTFFFTAKNAELKTQSAQRNMSGVVLCGGQSVRMGRDKAFIEYHSTPQYAYVNEMMKPFCDTVFISCNQTQQDHISEQYNKVIDNATFANAGPMTGLLSVWNEIHDTSLLVTGCDYPYFTAADMKTLLEARADDIDVVCYHNPVSGFDEPLLAFYEKQCAPLLFDFFKKGNTSLQQFLKIVRTKRIIPADLKNIQSIDR